MKKILMVCVLGLMVAGCKNDAEPELQESAGGSIGAGTNASSSSGSASASGSMSATSQGSETNSLTRTNNDASLGTHRP